MIISTMRPRPVLITVPALVIALVPLALRGGPLWEPMRYAQMGGMICATFRAPDKLFTQSKELVCSTQSHPKAEA